MHSKSKSNSFSIPSIKSSDAKQVSFDSSIFDKKIKNLKYKLLEKDNEILRQSKEIEALKQQLDEASMKIAQKNKEQDIETAKDQFYKDLITLNNQVDSFKAIHGYSEKISNSKSIAEEIDHLEDVNSKDLVRMRDILQSILKFERKLADNLLEVKVKVPEGFQNISSKDMSSRWNQDMNTFVAVLFELTKRHQVEQLNEANVMRLKYTQQQSELGRFKDINNKTKTVLDGDEKVINDLKREVIDFKRGKSHIYEEVNKLLKDQYDYKMKRTKQEYDRLTDSEEKLIKKLKLALKEDNKTIVKLSNSIVTLYNKQQDFQTEIKTLREEIGTKNDQLTKLYGYFKEEKTTLDKNELEERKLFKKDISSLRTDLKSKDSKVDELFIENKKLSSNINEMSNQNNNMSEKTSVLEEKSNSLEKKQMALLTESQNERKTQMESMTKQQQSFKDIQVKVRNQENENKLLNNMLTKFKEERKKLYESVITKNNEVNSIIKSKYFSDSNLDSLSSKLNRLEDPKPSSNNSDFYTTSAVDAKTSSNPRFNQVDNDEKFPNEFSNWKDAVKKMRFLQKEDDGIQLE